MVMGRPDVPLALIRLDAGEVPYAGGMQRGRAAGPLAKIGEGLPLRPSQGLADPFCGDTPQCPESESVDRFAVTGWKPRERPLAPVAENRDVQTQAKRRRQARPD